MQQAYATAAAAAQRQQRRQRAAQAVAAAADRRGGSCGSSGLCRGRVHGGGTCGVWQRRRQRWVWRQHWQQRRRLLMPHAGYGAWARRYSGDSPTAPACGGGMCGCVGMACGGVRKNSVWACHAHTRHTPGTHQAHAGQAHIMHVACTCHAHTGHAHTMLMAHTGAPQTRKQNKCLQPWGVC